MAIVAMIAAGTAPDVARHAANAYPDRAYPIQREDSRQHVAELQVYGGNTAVIIATCHHKLRSLLHGRILARLLVAAACSCPSFALCRRGACKRMNAATT